MLGFGTLAKMAKGGIGPDELAEICEAAGMDVEFSDVNTREDAKEAFGATATSLTRPGARLVRISGAMKGGDRMEALIVLVPSSKAPIPALKNSLTSPVASL